MCSQMFLDWSLSGVEREWPLEPQNDVNDPERTRCRSAILVSNKARSLSVGGGVRPRRSLSVPRLLVTRQWSNRVPEAVGIAAIVVGYRFSSSEISREMAVSPGRWRVQSSDRRRPAGSQCDRPAGVQADRKCRSDPQTQRLVCVGLVHAPNAKQPAASKAARRSSITPAMI